MTFDFCEWTGFQVKNNTETRIALVILSHRQTHTHRDTHSDYLLVVHQQ